MILYLSILRAVGGRGFWSAWWDGLRLVGASGTVAAIFLAALLAALGQGIIGVLWAVYVSDVLGGGPLEYGLVQAAVGIGSVGGGLVAARLAAREPGRVMGLGGIAVGLGLIGTFNLATLPPILALQLCVGLASMAAFVARQSLLRCGSTGSATCGRIHGWTGRDVGDEVPRLCAAIGEEPVVDPDGLSRRDRP